MKAEQTLLLRKKLTSSEETVIGPEKDARLKLPLLRVTPNLYSSFFSIRAGD